VLNFSFFNMKKKGQVWISAILYLALGVIIIALIIGLAMPMVGKMRDRNTYIQTKEMMFNLNKNVIDVINEGPGSKRYLSPLSIEKGELIIAPGTDDTIQWKFKTKNKLMETGMDFKEGDLTLRTDGMEGNYELTIKSSYANADIELSSVAGSLRNPFFGVFSMVIENSGYSGGATEPKITIKMQAT